MRQTRAKIIAEMGNDDEVRERIADYREPLEMHIRDNSLYSEIKTLGREILDKGYSR